MKLYSLEMLRSPCCRGELRKETGGQEQGLACEACGVTYPVCDGVPCLVHIDRTSLGDLTELLGHHAYYRIWTRTSEQAVRSPDWQQDYDRITAAAWRAFEQVLPEFDFTSSPRILDVGAGDGVTSALLAERNAVVVATDLRLNILHDPGDVETRRPLAWLPAEEQPQARARLRQAPYYVDRVQASADRLPFADGLFDYVFCRATLHHVPEVRKAIVEMSRVLRLGGKLVVCAEPFRAELDAEFDRVKEIHDYLVGVNEHYPRLRDYLCACRAAGLERPKLLTMELVPARRWEHASSLLPRAMRRVLRPLVWRELPERFVPLLRLSSGGVSLVAVKRRHRPGAHRSGPRLVDPGLMDGNVAHVPRLAQVARELRREVPFPSRLRTSKAPQDGLRLGWYLPEPVDPGPVRARYSFPYCVATLRVPPGAASLSIRCRGFSRVTGAPTHGTVRVNGTEIGAFCLEGADWQTLCFRLPAYEPIIDVELETQEVFVPNRYLNNGDTRAMGLAVIELAVTR